MGYVDILCLTDLISLEDISFTGLMRVKLKLMSNFPHIQVVDISFMEKPHIDYALKPIGGEHFGFDIANVCYLDVLRLPDAHDIKGPWTVIVHQRYDTCNAWPNDV